ncbi:hypothetical protein GCM10010412_051270 [Nonomuraea recticatena]|uniref:Uncharacterized protein n=1 Tax=Nonomuraea recticatena TaxID=46178 RepID=A0ABP6EMN8_9ACTN
MDPRGTRHVTMQPTIAHAARTQNSGEGPAHSHDEHPARLHGASGVPGRSDADEPSPLNA